MNRYQIASAVLGICLYLPLDWQILKGKAEQNAATWVLWGILDVLVASSLAVQHGSWILPGAYSVGSFSVVVCLIKANDFRWTWFETAITVMVIASIVGWGLSGPKLATIMLTMGVGFAGLPQIADAWRQPHMMPLAIFWGYTVSNALSTYGGTEWSVGQRFYPGVCTILTIVAVAVTMYRRPFRFPKFRWWNRLAEITGW